MRRRERMKKYRRECRERKSSEYSSLVREKEKLYDEWSDLMEEVERLQKNKAVLGNTIRMRQYGILLTI